MEAFLPEDSLEKAQWERWPLPGSWRIRKTVKGEEGKGSRSE